MSHLGTALVVDDNAINCRIASVFLAKAGYEAVTAVSGNEAIELVGVRHFDLILIDSHMPELDGASTVVQVRHILEERFTSTVIIGFSADDSSENRFRCEESGMNGFLAKPVRYHELLAEMIRCELNVIHTTSHK